MNKKRGIFMLSFIESINSILWGPIMLVLLLGTVRSSTDLYRFGNLFPQLDKYLAEPSKSSLPMKKVNYLLFRL